MWFSCGSRDFDRKMVQWLYNNKYEFIEMQQTHEIIQSNSPVETDSHNILRWMTWANANLYQKFYIETTFTSKV